MLDSKRIQPELRFFRKETTGWWEMLRKFGNLILIVLAGVTGFAAHADELKSRQVVGGDLIYSATSAGPTEEEAVFKAESQAVRMIAIECSIPHRETKIFRFSVSESAGKYLAQVSAGLPLQSCDEARNATPERKNELTNATFASSQRVYEQVLEGERKLGVRAVRAPAQAATQTQWVSQPVRYVYLFSSQFLAGYEHYLSAQVDRRERDRSSVRRGMGY
jgi:hypothetical protein